MPCKAGRSYLQIRLAERLGSMLNLSLSLSLSLSNIHPAIAPLILTRSVANERRKKARGREICGLSGLMRRRLRPRDCKPEVKMRGRRRARRGSLLNSQYLWSRTAGSWIDYRMLNRRHRKPKEQGSLQSVSSRPESSTNCAHKTCRTRCACCRSSYCDR